MSALYHNKVDFIIPSNYKYAKKVTTLFGIELHLEDGQRLIKRDEDDLLMLLCETCQQYKYACTEEFRLDINDDYGYSKNCKDCLVEIDRLANEKKAERIQLGLVKHHKDCEFEDNQEDIEF